MADAKSARLDVGAEKSAALALDAPELVLRAWLLRRWVEVPLAWAEPYKPAAVQSAEQSSSDVAAALEEPPVWRQPEAQEVAKPVTMEPLAVRLALRPALPAVLPRAEPVSAVLQPEARLVQEAWVSELEAAREP
jgi:hypothetical protein